MTETQKPKFSLLGAYKSSQGIKKEETNDSPAEATAGNLHDAGTGSDSGGKPEPVETAAPEAPARKSLLSLGKKAGVPAPIVQPGVSVPAVMPNTKPSSLLAGIQKAQERADARKEDYSYLFAEMPDDYQELLNRFDSLLIRDGQIDLTNIDLCRAYVKKIMKDVQEQPELFGLVIDRDIRNVIMFIRSVKETAIQDLQVKKEKGAKRKETAAKKKAVNRFGDVGTLDLNAAAPGTLEDFSNLDLDF